MNKQSIRVPDLGGATNVEVIELCVTSGDQISEGQSLIVVESDKASMDIPSPLSGKVLSIQVIEGAEVSEGDVIVDIEAEEKEDTSVVELSSQVIDEQESTKGEALVSEAVPPSSVGVSSQAVDQVMAVPDLGGADSVEMIELLVAVGDTVSEGDGLMVMESDKASMELPAPASGVVKNILVEEGAQLAQGQAVLELSISGSASTTTEAGETAVPAASSVEQEKPVETASDPVQAGAVVSTPAAPIENDNVLSSGAVYAGPAVRKLARELGIELSQVAGSGPKARISKEDLHAFVKKAVASPEASSPAGSSPTAAGIPQVPAVDFAAFGETDPQPMSKLHKLTAANMQRSWLNVPHVTQFDEADITELEAFRQSLKAEMQAKNIKVSPLPFILKAVAEALKTNPIMNASLGEDSTIIYKKYVHIGVAVDTPAGLFVPVIKDVDKKGIWALAEEVAVLAEKAKTRKLTPAEMQGGCFTVSSLGNIGGQGFTPIVNTPEVGILGVSRAALKPVYIDNNLEPRKMLPLTLSYDHRVVNGGDGGRFLTAVIESLNELRRLIL